MSLGFERRAVPGGNLSEGGKFRHVPLPIWGRIMGESERLEELLSRASVRRIVRLLTKQSRQGDCPLGRMIASYRQPHLSWTRKLKYGLLHLGIEWLRKRTGASVESIPDPAGNRRARFRGLLNVARGVGEFGLSRPQVFSAPLVVVWNLTQDCNLQCRHCSQNAGTPRGAELSLSEKIHVLDELAFNDVPALVFSGGEPLLAKDFWPVLSQARARGFHVSVTTNGTLLSREVAARLAEVGVAHVEVSIDSASPREHDEFRGQPGYWVQAVEGLRNVVADGRLGTGLACTVTACNLDQLDDIIQMSRGLGAGIFHVLDFVPTGRGRDIPEIDLSPQQRQRMLGVLAGQLDAGLAVLATAPQFGPGGRQRDELGRRLATVPCGAATPNAVPVPARYLGGCGAGHSVLAIQPNGDITPCLFLPLVIGNLRQHHIRNLWRQSEVLHLLRDRDALRGHCGVCDWKAGCGGCRARAYAYTGDLAEADPGCLLNTPPSPPPAKPEGELFWRFPAAAESLVEGD